jgi:GAF domain-containing protein
VLVEADMPVAPTDDAAGAPSTQVAQLSSTALEDVFLEIPRMFDDQMEVPDAIDFVLDLAHRHVPSEHALLMFTSGPEDGEELHLYAAAARGPASETLLSARFSLEAGIPAASLQAGITLSIGSPARDARHNDELRRAGVREERCLLVAPIQYQDRAFGVLVLLNREGSPVFTEGDSNVIAYVGKEMGRFIQQVIIDPAP